MKKQDEVFAKLRVFCVVVRIVCLCHSKFRTNNIEICVWKLGSWDEARLAWNFTIDPPIYHPAFQISSGKTVVDTKQTFESYTDNRDARC